MTSSRYKLPGGRTPSACSLALAVHLAVFALARPWSTRRTLAGRPPGVQPQGLGPRPPAQHAGQLHGILLAWRRAASRFRERRSTSAAGGALALAGLAARAAAWRSCSASTLASGRGACRGTSATCRSVGSAASSSSTLCGSSASQPAAQALVRGGHPGLDRGGGARRPPSTDHALFGRHRDPRDGRRGACSRCRCWRGCATWRAPVLPARGGGDQAARWTRSCAWRSTDSTCAKLADRDRGGDRRRSRSSTCCCTPATTTEPSGCRSSTSTTSRRSGPRSRAA